MALPEQQPVSVRGLWLTILGPQHQPRHAPTLDQVDLENLVQILSRPVGVPGAFGIDDHRRPQLSAIEAARRVDPNRFQAQLLRLVLHVGAKLYRLLGRAASARMAIGSFIRTTKHMLRIVRWKIFGLFTHDIISLFP